MAHGGDTINDRITVGYIAERIGLYVPTVQRIFAVSGTKPINPPCWQQENWPLGNS